MIDLILAGGGSMIFVMLLGLGAVGAAAMGALRQSERARSALTGLTIATVFSSVGGVASCLAAVGYHVSASPEWRTSPELPSIVMTGIAESMSPATFGFGLLALAWAVASFARRSGAMSAPAPAHA